MLDALLAQRRPLLAAGATGTTLFAAIVAAPGPRPAAAAPRTRRRNQEQT